MPANSAMSTAHVLHVLSPAAVRDLPIDLEQMAHAAPTRSAAGASFIEPNMFERSSSSLLVGVGASPGLSVSSSSSSRSVAFLSTRPGWLHAWRMRCRSRRGRSQGSTSSRVHKREGRTRSLTRTWV